MRTQIFGFWLVLTVAADAQLPSASLKSAGFDASRIDILHASTKRFVDEGLHAGIITLLVKDGKLVDFQAFGYRDLEKRLPMERDTICRIYSMSKIITSVAALALMEDGRFNLSDSVSDYLPEFKSMKVMTGGTADSPKLEPATRPITLLHLFTHTSGLIYDFSGGKELSEMYKRADLWTEAGLNGFVSKLAKLPLQHQPGQTYTYGVNTDVLGALIEKLSGQTLGEFLQQRIFAPLAMRDTGFDLPPEKMTRLARTYNRGTDGKFVEAAPIIETWPERGRGIESGGGGLFSTAGDYVRFAQMLLNGGTLDGHRILGRKTVELMTANHLVTLPDNQAANREKGFGLGVEVTTELGRLTTPSSVGQFGWYGAATTYCQIDPRERIVAIALAQHFPFNEFNFFSKFTTGYYQALK